MEVHKGVDGAAIPYAFHVLGCPPMCPELGFVEFVSSPYSSSTPVFWPPAFLYISFASLPSSASGQPCPLPKRAVEKEASQAKAEQKRRDKKARLEKKHCWAKR
jgi:hypothetical protein